MKIAIVSDEYYPVGQFVADWLREHGHEVLLFGALQSKQEASWVNATRDAAMAVAEGRADEGIFFCWTGTGATIVANRFPAIRAALCVDAETVRAARLWNHANVLVLSNRLTTQDLAKEMLQAWFEDYDADRGACYIKELAHIK